MSKIKQHRLEVKWKLLEGEGIEGGGGRCAASSQSLSGAFSHRMLDRDQAERMTQKRHFL